ncbi:VWA domain-containing protein [Zobellia sp.]|nr:VWA domain-containing protein [Zobellia sp.]
MIHKIIISLLLLVTINSWSQNRTDKTSRTVINAHVTYVNFCTNHIAAMNRNANDFNYDLDQSVKMPEEQRNQWIRRVALKYDGQLHYEYTHAQLDSIYSKTVEQRNNLPPADKQTLNDFFDGYQKLIHATNANFDAIKEFAGDGRQIFSNVQIEQGYEMLTTLEDNIKELAGQNVIFSDLASNLFGKEELPAKLRLTKDIAGVCQQIVRQIRNQDEEGLVKSMLEHEKLIKIRNTSKELKELETFGDYRYTDNIQTQERANIGRGSKKFAEYADRYVNGGSAYATDYTSKRYGRQFAFEQSVIYLFHDYGLKLCKRYNEVIARAYEPVLKMVQEPMPFKVHYESGYEPKVETTMVESQRLPTENRNALVAEDRETQPDNRLETSTKPIILAKDDLSTLSGASTNNLVLLLDVSASMRRNDNLDKLKSSITYLIDLLRPEDQLTVITYSGIVEKVLETSSNYDKENLKSIIQNLKSNGKTNANAGLDMAYKSCRNTFLVGGNNRIIIASDGDFQISAALKKYIGEQAKKDIYLTTFHYFSPKMKVGHTLDDLAEKGQGTYTLITDKKDAITALIKESKR